MSYEFAGGLYPTLNAMLRAIADDWLWQTSNAELEALDPTQEARECFGNWELDVPGSFPWEDEDPIPAHCVKNGYYQEDLMEAMIEYINERLEKGEEV